MERPQSGSPASSFASSARAVGFCLWTGRLNKSGMPDFLQQPVEQKNMKELHTPEPWESSESTEDFQGHFIFGDGRTIAATITQDACEITREDLANCCLIVIAPSMLRTLRQIAREADFRQDDGAMQLG